MPRTLTLAEKERLQAQLHAIHQRTVVADAEKRLALQQPRQQVVGRWVQPCLPGLEEWLR